MLSGVLKADRTAWESIWAGGRPPAWADMFGHVSQTGTLTPRGADLCERAAEFLDEYLTAAWLPRALGYDGGGEAGVPFLRRFCPVSPNWPEGVVSELLTWATTLRAVVDAAPTGARQMRLDTRGDVTENRLVHTLAMARLAAMGLAADAAVELETQRDDTFADVVWRRGADKVAIEVVAMTAGQQWATATAASDAASMRLDHLAATFGVHFHGEVPREAVAPQEEAWWHQLMRLSRKVGRTGRPQTATTTHPTGQGLHVSPGFAPTGSTMTFPLIEVDEGRRMLAKLRSKAKQTARGGPAVLWVEDMGLLGPLTRFDSLPLDVQVRELAEYIEPVLDANQHVAAVVLCAGSGRTTRSDVDQSVTRRHGHGLVRAVGRDRQRRTLVVAGPAANASTTALLVDLVGREQELLNISLSTTEGVAGFDAVFTGRLAEG